MGYASKKFFGHTHYGISTVAAVLYAIAWMLGNQVRADSNEQFVLPAVIVTAQRAAESVAMLDPVLVTAAREPTAERYTMLDPVFVFASRDVGAAGSADEPSAILAASHSQAGTPRTKSFFGTMRSWVVNALIK